MNMKSIFSAFALVPVFAAAIPVISGSTDKDPASYAIGETMTFSFTAEENGEPCAARLDYVMRKDGVKGETRGFIDVKADAPGVVTNAMSEPGFVMISARLVDAAGEPVRDEGSRVQRFGLAAGAALEHLKPVKEPEDFDVFWKGVSAEIGSADLSKAELSPVPPDVAAQSPDRAVRALRVPMPDGSLASAFVSWPGNAGDGTLPIVMHFYGYGNGGSGFSRRMHAENAICVDVNAHGFELLRDKRYYDEFMMRVSDGGEGGGYGFHPELNAKPETCYFRNMIARDLLVARFAKTLPQWDGRNIAVRGGSQGGFQAVAVAALDPAVTSVSVNAPWLCDLGGAETFGRIRGWAPAWTPALGYFDTVAFGRRVSCPVDIERCGLADGICRPAGVTLLYNALRGEKSIRYVQNSVHMDFGAIPENVQQQKITNAK